MGPSVNTSTSGKCCHPRETSFLGSCHRWRMTRALSLAEHPSREVDLW